MTGDCFHYQKEYVVLLKLCLLIICLFPSEVRAKVVNSPVRIPPVLNIESVQNLCDLIRVELVQQAVYRDHTIPYQLCPYNS